jgi:hypothetical protein
MKTIQFINITPEDLTSILEHKIFEFLKKPDDEVLLTQQEVADFYKVSKPTIIKWQREGKINVYSIDNERRYKKSELLNSLKKIKQNSKYN